MHLLPLMTIAVEVEETVSAGVTPIGEVRLVRFTSGTFEGDGLRGHLLPGGTDWQQVRADGALEIRAHYLLQTEQNEVIEVISEGLRDASPRVLARIAAGEAVDPAEYYFRTSVAFETAAPKYDWLNRIIAVGTGDRRPEGPIYDIFEVL